MDRHPSLASLAMAFHVAVDEQQQASSSTPIPSSRAWPDAGWHIRHHAYSSTQQRASLLVSSIEDTSGPVSASDAVAVGAPSQRCTFSLLSGPEYHRRYSSLSSRHNLDRTVDEFLQKATNDADVPPGLLDFLERQRNHQLQQQQTQPHSQARPLAHSSLVPTPSMNSVRIRSHRTPPSQSSAAPSHRCDSTTSHKAAMASRASSNNSNVADGKQFCWLVEAVTSEIPRGLEEEDEKKRRSLSAVGGGSSNAHARTRATTVTATAKQLESYLLPQRRYSSHAMTAPPRNSQGATERCHLPAEALRRRYSTIEDVCEGVRGGDGHSNPVIACLDSGASLPRLQRAHRSPSSTAIATNTHPSDCMPSLLQVSNCSPPRRARGNTAKAVTVSIHEVAGVQPHRVQQPREPHQPLHSAQNHVTEHVCAGSDEAVSAVVDCGDGVAADTYQPASSTPLIPAPPSVMPSALRGINTSGSARFAVHSARQSSYVVDDDDSSSRSCVPPAPLLQLSLAAPRASSRMSVSARLVSSAATANAMILSEASITDVSHAKLPPVAAACSMLAPARTSAEKSLFGGLGMPSAQQQQHHHARFRRLHTGGASNHSNSAVKSAGAEAVAAAAAVSLIDVTTAESVSGRMSSYEEMEPSLTAGVVWVGPLASYAASITSPTTGTLTSTTNYCCSGASNSIST
ncbi:hypothetical protein LtaPh_0407100 [Leishmania tarentolae]|uniref:Uncharacterized protein n=1 Tax=Leishmania tarentolae TaxID=5689 RepID=A0A640KDU1_LEITA|nr:hypothetical protein LtaPh_0407100 [Leishmania tarentolae]